ncbi:hypothetical protein HGH93_09015 [Chitinophaga polysaccharea]|uniref:hypothetical protein n=1 Tax=Chitinophaga polysaccharea TaxID=1293035 RepID=UPI0014559BCA|nr:hypothetical protein [Chitinophaga polysaccharea]NLR58236.1 hypothetical protein [Chitinophaga polysaccharea]
MGLDLWHVKPTDKKHDSVDFFYVDELEECPPLVENHRQLICDLVEATHYFTIYIFQANQYLNYYISRFDYSEADSALLAGSIQDLAMDIFNIEAERNLDIEEKMITETHLRDNTDPGGPLLWTTQISYPIAFSKRQVIYFEEVGYQRKGMNMPFYSEFVNCKPYFYKADVLKAASYLDIDHRPEVTMYFPTEFIDNFIEGKSVFFASW